MTFNVNRAYFARQRRRTHLAQLVEQRRSFTARSVDRLIKVARTIADLIGQDGDQG